MAHSVKQATLRTTWKDENRAQHWVVRPFRSPPADEKGPPAGPRLAHCRRGRAQVPHPCRVLAEDHVRGEPHYPRFSENLLAESAYADFHATLTLAFQDTFDLQHFSDLLSEAGFFSWLYPVFSWSCTQCFSSAPPRWVLLGNAHAIGSHVKPPGTVRKKLGHAKTGWCCGGKGSLLGLVLQVRRRWQDLCSLLDGLLIAGWQVLNNPRAGLVEATRIRDSRRCSIAGWEGNDVRVGHLVQAEHLSRVLRIASAEGARPLLDPEQLDYARAARHQREARCQAAHHDGHRVSAVEQGRPKGIGDFDAPGLVVLILHVEAKLALAYLGRQLGTAKLPAVTVSVVSYALFRRLAFFLQSNSFGAAMKADKPE